MELTELFEQNPWWKDKEEIKNDYDIEKWEDKKYKWTPHLAKEINLEPFALHIISGPRQAGKTTLLKLMIKDLIEKKDPKSIFYFNCENISDYKELLEVLKLYIEFKESNEIKKSVIFLDEITLPKEWYRAIKFLIDQGKFKNDVLILTGSSTLFSKKEVELFPGRRGKGEDFVLYPLSFRGFLEVVNPELIKKISQIKTINDIEKKVLNALLFRKELNKYLEKYMEYGGFPLSIANLDIDKVDAKKTYLSWIKNAILKADRNDLIARQIINVLIEGLQTNLSWEGISKKIEIKSPKTVSSYLDLLNSIFVINVLYNLDISGKKIKFGKNKKIHFRDPLLLEIFEDWCLIKSKNKMPAIAESLVVEHLSRFFPEKVFFWKNGIEVDAIVLEKEKVYGFEVKWSESFTAVKQPNQLKKFFVITKNEYSKTKEQVKIPLAVFLVIFGI